ncbi:MAG: autotransporter-associated beta strand repeat-containing protein [Limisphaerales bacterium]
MLLIISASAQIGGSGWSPKNVKFNVQWPYNTNESSRYTLSNGVYHCLVYSNDAPFKVDTTTLPRTEQRFTPDYTNGDIQYQATLMAPSDENSYCIFQIHTGDAQSPTYGSTTFMLFWFTSDGGSVHDYSGTELAKNLGNRWFQLNVDHNLVTRAIKVWINQKLVWTQEDNGAGDFYMKDGVYEQHHNPTLQMDAYLTNILMWNSPGSPIVPLTWTGRTNGVNVGAWDLGMTTNWVNSTNGAIQFYQDGSSVTFDDSAPGDTTVNLQAKLQPASVIVSNAVKNYTFTGSGSLGGSASLLKYGDGTLTVDTANSFTGGVTIQNGTLKAGNASALGSTNGTTVITDGGTLDVNGFNLADESVMVSGSGMSGNGAIVNNGAQQTSALRVVTLNGDATFGGTSRWDVRNSGGAASLLTGGHSFNITKVGTNQVSLVGVNPIDSALGDIDIQQGTFAIQTSTTQLGNMTNSITVHDGATLELWTLNASPLNKKIALNDGATVFNEKGPSVIIGPVTLQGNAIFNVTTNGTPPMLVVSNVISGSGNLTLVGGGNLVFSAINNYSADTTISKGTLSLTGNGSISNSAIIAVAAGATLDVSERNSALTLANGQTLTGNGILNGNVIVGNGATLLPGGALTTLTFNNNLTLNGGSTTIVEVSKSPATNDVAQVVSNLLYGGTLVVTNISANSFSAGDNFKLFSAASYHGGFTNIFPAIPALNLAWDTNALSSGILSIVAMPTPPPKIGVVKINTNNFILSGSNGVPNWPYYVLTSTNLALPLSQWTVIATNTFDGGGNFNLTNANLNMLRAFYLLKLQ